MLSEESLKKMQDIKGSLESQRDAKKKKYWDKLVKYCLPDLLESSDDQTPAYTTAPRRYTSLASNALQGWAYGRSISWLQLALEDRELEEETDAKEWLQQCEKIILSDLAKSSFYDEAISFTNICFNLSTAIMLVDFDEATETYIFENLNPRHCVLGIDARTKRPDLLMYEFWVNKDDAIDLFGEDNLPAKIKNSKDWTELYQFTKLIVNSKKYDFSSEVPGEDEWIEAIWSEDELTKTVSERRLSYNPVIVWQYERSLDGSPWGKGSPGESMLPSILTLDAMEKATLRGIQIRNDPPIKATRGLEVNLRPGSVTYLSGNQDFAFSAPPGNAQEVLTGAQRIEQELKESYYVDFFLMLQQTLENQKTATEASLLSDERSQMMSAFTSRLSVQFLEPVIEAIFLIGLAHGRFPAPPEAITESELRVDYVSPLATAQKKAQIYAPARQFIAEVLSFAEVDSGVFHKIKLDEYIDDMAVILNVDRRFIRDQKEVDQLRAQDQQRAEAQLQSEINKNNANAQATAYNAMTKAPEAGSPAEQLTGQNQAV